LARAELRFVDGRGIAHTRPEDAVARDLAHKIAGPGTPLLVAQPIARWIIENRDEIERGYALIDQFRKDHK
jgi:hypothetical protein